MVLATLLLVLIPTSVAKADSVVTFPDPNLQAAIRAAINKPSGDILQSDLVGLTSLSAESAGITNLTGLEHCTSLTSLDLFTNQISNLSPLAGLTGLVVLFLQNNQISDISPLSGLTNLQWLAIALNHITDLSPLSGLTSLWSIYLSSNQISDLSPLSGLTSLNSLIVQHNQIINISPLSGLTSLTALYLDYNQIINVSPLAGLIHLGNLGLEYNQITNISPLSGLTGLGNLYLNDNQISDLLPLSGLTSVVVLYLNDNQISDVSPLAGPTSLMYLHLEDNQISDIGPLVSNTGLGRYDCVYLASNPLSITSVNVYIPQLQAREVTVSWGGTANQAPNQPSNLSPANGATGWSLTPTLGSSGFSDPDAGDAHAASQWQMTTTPNDYSTPVLNLTSGTRLTSYPLASGILDYSQTYYWHVRYQDNHGAWSSYSTETSFTTLAAPPPNTPVGSPVTVSLSGVTVTFGSVTVAGYTSVTQESAPCGTPPSGYIARGLVQHITTTATYSGTVTVAMSYDGSGIPTEGDMRLFHCDGTNWKDVTTSVDTVANIIHGQDSALSWWWIGDPPSPSGGGGGHSAPVVPSVWIGIGAALGAGVVAYALRRRLAPHRTE